jgi:hypothetical protein
LGALLSIFINPTILNVTNVEGAGLTMYSHIGYIFYYSQVLHIDLLDLNIYRQHGMHWEPGVFQFYPNVLIFAALSGFYSGKKKMLLVLLGSIGVILSTSSTGLMIMFVLVIMYFMRRHGKSFLSVSNAIKFGVIILLFLPLIYIFIINKLSFDSPSALSFVMRIVDFESPITTALRYPFFGIGNNPDAATSAGLQSHVLDFLSDTYSSPLISYYESVVDSDNLLFRTSNGLFSVLMQYGFIYFAVYLVGIYRFSVRFGGLMFFVLCLGMLLNEPVAFSTLFTIFSIVGIMLDKNTMYNVAHQRFNNDYSSQKTNCAVS